MTVQWPYFCKFCGKIWPYEPVLEPLPGSWERSASQETHLCLPYRVIRGWHNVDPGSLAHKAHLCFLRKGKKLQTHDSGLGQQSRVRFQPSLFPWLGAFSITQMPRLMVHLWGGCVPQGARTMGRGWLGTKLKSFSLAKLLCLSTQVHMPEKRAFLPSHKGSLSLPSSAPTSWECAEVPSSCGWPSTLHQHLWQPWYLAPNKHSVNISAALWGLSFFPACVIFSLLAHSCITQGQVNLHIFKEAIGNLSCSRELLYQCVPGLYGGSTQDSTFGILPGSSAVCINTPLGRNLELQHPANTQNSL